MKLRIVVLLALLMGLVTAAPHEALITKVSGAVTLQGKPVKTATRLDKGAKLEVAKGASVTVVYLTDARKETLNGPGVLTVGGASQGALEKTSGPGAITRELNGNSKGAVASVRAGEPASFESIRTGAGGQSELVFAVYQDSTIYVEVYPVDEQTNQPGKVLAKVESPQGKNSRVEHPPLPTEKDGHQHRVVPLGVTLQEGVPYRVTYWTSADFDFPEKIDRWIIALPPEKADALLEMQRWAYAEPPSADRLLAFVQIAYEWKAYGEALMAAGKANELEKGKNEDASEVYRRLLLLDGQKGRSQNLSQ